MYKYFLYALVLEHSKNVTRGYRFLLSAQLPLKCDRVRHVVLELFELFSFSRIEVVIEAQLVSEWNWCAATTGEHSQREKESDMLHIVSPSNEKPTGASL